MTDARETLDLQVPRFRPTPDWYVARRRAGLVECFVWSPAERLLRSYLSLLEQLDADVDVAVESRRDDVRWRGERIGRDEVRAALAPLQRPLTTHGGVELSVYTADDQLTITPELALVIYARSDRWLYLLDAAGFVERAEVPTADWQPPSALPDPVPSLARLLGEIATRLALEPG